MVYIQWNEYNKMPHRSIFSKLANQPTATPPTHPPLRISPALHHINWITNPTTVLPPSHRTFFNCFRSEVANKWRGCGVRSDTEPSCGDSHTLRKNTAFIRLFFACALYPHFSFAFVLLCINNNLMVLNQTFPNCGNAVHATMTQITVICFDYISVFFFKFFYLFCHLCKILGERTDASIRAFTDE